MNKILILFLMSSFFSYSIPPIQAQALPITYIEVFGNRASSSNAIINKAGIHEGDTIARPAYDEQILATKIKTIPAVKQAHIETICCEERTGGLILFIGISETDRNYFSYHKNPSGSISLPKEITKTYLDFTEAMRKAVMSGNGSEDYSNGYSLMNDSAARNLQMKFIGFANKDQELLRKVIHEASDPEQREIATWIIAYNDNKKEIIPDLLYAVSDPNDGVRNNATRALSILSRYSAEQPSLNIEIPASGFINMIHSIIWTDRNKGSAVLEGLTRSRNRELMHSLKKNALPELIEMAKWRSKGHAYFSFAILGRMAEIQEEQIDKLFENHIENLDLIIQKIYKPKTFTHFAKAHPSKSYLPLQPLLSL